MKTERISLYKWYSKEDVIEVNWPEVHKTIGADHLEWILKQPKDQCQLVVDKLNTNFELMAEFYNERVLVEYWMRWAK
jgi:hypothetical protein